MGHLGLDQICLRDVFPLKMKDESLFHSDKVSGSNLVQSTGHAGISIRKIPISIYIFILTFRENSFEDLLTRLYFVEK